MFVDFIRKCRAVQCHSFEVDSEGHDPFWRDFEDPEYQSTLVVPDQSLNNPVFMNPCGFPANDIQKLLEAEAKGDVLSTAYYNSKMQSSDASYLPSDMSEDDMFRSTPSRYAQDPVELIADSDRISQVLDSKIYEDLNNPSSQEDGKIKFESSDNDNNA